MLKELSQAQARPVNKLLRRIMGNALGGPRGGCHQLSLGVGKASQRKRHLSWVLKAEWEFTGQREDTGIACRGRVMYKNGRRSASRARTGGGAVLRDEARQVGRGQITASFSKGKCAL